MKQKEEYTTNRLEEAAFLVAKGYELKSKNIEGNFVSFTFEGNGIHETKLDYYNDGIVQARKFHEAYRDLRAIAVRTRKERENEI